MDVKELLLKLMSFGGHSDNSLTKKNSLECLKFLSKYLKDIGFCCDLQQFNETGNLYATIGREDDCCKKLCFCGHCDVVPAKNWEKKPTGEIVNDRIYGRGAVDMLGGLSAWISAIEEIFKKEKKILDNANISLLITGDEENDGKDGTIKMVEYLKQKNVFFDACVVGEPTSEYDGSINDDDLLFDKQKLNGLCNTRGGSFGVSVKKKKKSGHIGYVGEFVNPITRAVNLCHSLKKIKWKKPTNLEVVHFDAKNDTTNVILDCVDIYFNVRFFNMKRNKVKEKVMKVCKKFLTSEDEIIIHSDRVGYNTKKSDKFVCLAFKVLKDYNQDAKLVSARGVSDAEHMAKVSKSVIELGLKCKTMHQQDEYTTIQELDNLKNIYKQIILNFFSKTE